MIHGYPARVASLLGAEHARLLLSLADEEHALLTRERGEVFLRDVVLPLALLEGHQIDPLGGDEPLDGRDELLTHGRDHHRRGHPSPELAFHEVDESAARLQRRDVGIEIHPVDGLQLEGHVIREDLGDVFAYHDGGAPGERGPRGHRPDRVYHLGAGRKPCHAPGAPLFLTRPCLRPAGVFGVHNHMLDGLRQGLVRHLLKPVSVRMKQVLALESVLAAAAGRPPTNEDSPPARLSRHSAV